ncbi:NAD(P)H-dependent oxidoreductase [uncultured Flavobacterium sp.]|uniref:NADPH-dependent FMN reductase n=1 Tax=uncultured Flavobacterium sp. TaxID=165435 RepID=UPI0025F4520B|nr:NAD(P)H-dependent oxidoreductase [uncultured Flavobacterium sp.]
MKIIAFAGSNSSKSINKKLATYASSLFKNVEVEILDLREYQAPLFSADVEKEIGQAVEAVAFLEKLKSADILVISLAENNGNYSTAFKNIFDWCSRIEKDVFQNKPTLLMATSPGARGGKSVLEIAQTNLPRYGAAINAVFSLPSFNENFDVENGKISSEEYDNQLKEIINNFSA